MSQDTRDLRKKLHHHHHCVPHSAKGEEGQPVPEKAPGPPGLPTVTGEGLGPQAASGNIMPPAVPGQSWLSPGFEGSPWPGPFLLQTLQSSPPSPAHRCSPIAGAPDCISLWGAALASACLATSFSQPDYFLLPQLPLNMSVGVF